MANSVLPNIVKCRFICAFWHLVQDEYKEALALSFTCAAVLQCVDVVKVKVLAVKISLVAWLGGFSLLTWIYASWMEHRNQKTLLSASTARKSKHATAGESGCYSNCFRLSPFSGPFRLSAYRKLVTPLFAFVVKGKPIQLLLEYIPKEMACATKDALISIGQASIGHFQLYFFAQVARAS